MSLLSEFIQRTHSHAKQFPWSGTTQKPTAFSDSTGNWMACILTWIHKVRRWLVPLPNEIQPAVRLFSRTAAGDTTNSRLTTPVVATDPTLLRQYRIRRSLGLTSTSGMRRTLRDIWPGLFRRLFWCPKDEELVATPYRHGGKVAAERFFMEGMGEALVNMHRSSTDEFPADHLSMPSSSPRSRKRA